MKPSTTSTSLVEPQNPSNSSDIACTSKVKRGKNYEKKREKKRVMKGLAGMSLADLDQESSDHSSGQTKRARESSDFLSSTTNLPQKRGQHEAARDM